MLGVFLSFTLIYSVKGDPNSEAWSGMYFFINYLTLLFLFKNHANKYIRIFGIALSISILIFIICKYLLNLHLERHYTIIPFIITFIGLLKIEHYEPRSRTNP